MVEPTEHKAQNPFSKSGKSGARQKRALEQATGSASSIFMMVIVLLVNYLAFRHYQRQDWTSQGMFTLSGKSLKVVKGLHKDVDLYLFLSQGEPSYEDTDELLKRYAAVSNHVKLHRVDPDREPGQFKLLAQRYGVLQGTTQTGETRADVAAIAVMGDKHWHVNRDDLVGLGAGDPDGQDHELNVKAEQALTGAIVQVASGRATKVCVTKGHGEWSVEDGNERSLEGLKTGLRHDNVEWEAFETLGKKQVPKGCDAVYVLGPLRAFSDAEAKLILDYVHGGGNALLALDPVIEQDVVQATGFEEALKGVGVRLDSSLVIELNPEHLLSPNTVEFVVTGFGDHPTTRALKGGARVVVAMARSLSVLQQSERIETLLRTSDQAFGATNIAAVMAKDEQPTRGSGDLKGPLDLALAVQVTGDPGEVKAAAGGRLIVAGDSDFLQSTLLESPELANFHLASAWTGWLTQRQALIEIPPKKISSGNIVFTQEGVWGLIFRVGVLLPGAALLLGIAVWWSRRA